jgi:hypothetical protein
MRLPALSSGGAGVLRADDSQLNLNLLRGGYAELPGGRQRDYFTRLLSTVRCARSRYA